MLFANLWEYARLVELFLEISITSDSAMLSLNDDQLDKEVLNLELVLGFKNKKD